MKIGITNIKIETFHSRKFNNGLFQNIVYIYNFLIKNNENTIYYISDDETCEYNNIKVIHKNDVDNLINLDIIIFIGTSIDLKIVNILKKKKIKLINMILGNDFVNFYEDVLYRTDDSNNNSTALKLIEGKDKLFDEIWISPHFEYSIDYYKYIYQTQNIYISPYIWEPLFIGDRYNYFNHKEINIAVFEPNFSFIKSSFIPIIICDRAKHLINNVIIGSTQKFIKNSCFSNFAKISSLVKEKRIIFCARHSFKYIMDKHCNVVVSFTQDCDLNYLTLECFYLGIPIIHNSKMLKDWGYYYDGCNVDMAVNHIKSIKENFNRENYILKHKDVLKKYSMENVDYIEFFKNRLMKDIDMENKVTLIDDVNKYDLVRKDSYLYNDLVKKNIIKNTKLLGIHPHHNFSCDIDNEEFIKINTEVKVINNNDIASFVISVNEKRKSEMKNKLGNNIYFIEVEKFPKNCSGNIKHKIVLNSHISCWKKALDMNLDEAFIFEDDVIFMKNWRNIINEFINIKKPDIIRFDSIPWRHLSDLNNNQIAFYKEIDIWCMGGYYLTKQAMEYCVEFFSDKSWNWKSCEAAFAEANQYFYNSIYTSTPRICIQDWFKQKESRIQDDSHMKNLYNSQKFYLDQFSKYYNDTDLSCI